MVIVLICLMEEHVYNWYEKGYMFYLKLGLSPARALEFIHDDFDVFFDPDYRPKDFSYYYMIR